MTRFNLLLILLAGILFFGCMKVALADPCESKPLSELNQLSSFLKQTELHPEFMYHYNGYSVTKEEYEMAKRAKPDKKQDPNIMRLP